MIHDKAHGHPGDGFGSPHGRDEELVRQLAKYHETGLVVRTVRILQKTRHRRVTVGNLGRRGGDQVTLGVEQENDVGADALGVVPGR